MPGPVAAASTFFAIAVSPSRVRYLRAGGGGAAPSVSTLRVECPRNVRVGENSPSRCPTMSSVTNTFRCLLPLWTMNVCPTKSGMIVEDRAHVVIGSLAPESFCRSTFLSRSGATNGPFLSERPMALLPFLVHAAPHDEAAGELARVARLAALGELAPGRRRLAAFAGAAFAAAVRVRVRAHR